MCGIVLKITGGFMTTEFTPGPWEVLAVKGEIFVAAKPVEGHPYFNRTRTTEIMSDEDYPRKIDDAHLISAAPELYEALYYMMKVDCGARGIMKARAAILKATGEKI
jgi:hypothetical protein